MGTASYLFIILSFGQYFYKTLRDPECLPKQNQHQKNPHYATTSDVSAPFLTGKCAVNIHISRVSPLVHILVTSKITPKKAKKPHNHVQQTFLLIVSP